METEGDREKENQYQRGNVASLNLGAFKRALREIAAGERASQAMVVRRALYSYYRRRYPILDEIRAQKGDEYIFGAQPTRNSATTRGT